MPVYFADHDLERHIATFGAASNVSEAPTAVIQVKPGIGDVIWHLPFIRAIAAACAGRQSRRSWRRRRAGPGSCLPPNPASPKTIYFRPWRLGARAWHQSDPAVAVATAPPLPDRSGFSIAPLAPRSLPCSPASRNASAWDLVAQATVHHQSRASTTAISTTIRSIGSRADGGDEGAVADRRARSAGATETLLAIAAKFAAEPRPWIVLGIGASHPDKDWPEGNWAEFSRRLAQADQWCVFLIGGPRITRARKS